MRNIGVSVCSCSHFPLRLPRSSRISKAGVLASVCNNGDFIRRCAAKQAVYRYRQATRGAATVRL